MQITHNQEQKILPEVTKGSYPTMQSMCIYLTPFLVFSTETEPSWCLLVCLFIVRHQLMCVCVGCRVIRSSVGKMMVHQLGKVDGIASHKENPLDFQENLFQFKPTGTRRPMLQLNSVLVSACSLGESVFFSTDQIRPCNGENNLPVLVHRFNC